MPLVIEEVDANPPFPPLHIGPSARPPSAISSASASSSASETTSNPSINPAAHRRKRQKRRDPNYTLRDSRRENPLREWFINNLGCPYPSEEDKAQLQQQCPHLNAAQINTFFVNFRRRTGWMELFKTYAESDMGVMGNICAACLDPRLQFEMDQKVVRAVHEMVRRLNHANVFKARSILPEQREDELAATAPNLVATVSQLPPKPVPVLPPRPPLGTGRTQMPLFTIPDSYFGKPKEPVSSSTRVENGQEQSNSTNSLFPHLIRTDPRSAPSPPPHRELRRSMLEREEEQDEMASWLNYDVFESD
ncbi:hypothetical protein BT69DRAFT_1359092 [Atractiella rhizophila]|nr:hypothetical protein BT69DRAFT_1359092 [Atractiella rhizophila]